MTIPLDRLYHYLENIAQEIRNDRVIIYRFWPHGSKNINALNFFNETSWIDATVFPAIWCNDQEPLDHKFYSINLYNFAVNEWTKILKSVSPGFPHIKNLNYNKNIFEKNLLLHSEKRSCNLEKYQIDNELIPVYYWSHGIIAQDWFRYAKHETFQKNTKKTFLIYNRAWSGTREYRLRFSDLLIKNKLIDQCQTNCNPIDPDLNIHYANYTFTNTQWKPTHVLENYLQPAAANSNSSADFNTNDYNSTDIEIVLETLFDDDRLHLTEKSLRPIACGQPFILAATHSSLEYLRSYGFKTFDTVWNESYDQIQNPEERMIAVVNLMQQIARWNLETRAIKMAQARFIADYNRRWFFSNEFNNLVVNELKTNLKSAFNKLEHCNNYQTRIDYFKKIMTYPEMNNFLNTNQNTQWPTKDSVEFVIKLAQNKLSKVAHLKK
jgi:hypothetical protein